MEARLEIAPYDYAAARRLERELAVSHVVAQVLVRRGFADPAAARAFLAAETAHALDDFAGLREAASLIASHVRRGSHVTVHGDYDCDGVCSTAILVRALHTLGARVDWYLPSRSEDGYGLAAATVERLAARGTDLLITADCAITAVEEVAAARAAGMEVVVTDHHQPRADGALPDAPIVHPELGGYPCPELCATGVAYKLAAALLEASGLDGALADEDLDLVALATVADVVPLVGENRRLVRAGLHALSVTRKPGLQALMEVARVDPGELDAGAIGFRLAPRINAAGRLHRADAPLELLLTDDAERARAVAQELDACNAERRDVETRIRFEAEALAAQTPGAPAYVLAAEGWHPGVVGIVAARIAERHHRPAVLIALDGEEGTGSGRSIPAFDLLGGLRAASEHLGRFGGHRAAAGLSVARTDVDTFREAFVAHAASVLAPEDLVPSERVDAVAPGDGLGLPLADELERLAPFGMGNPAVNLLVPAALLDDPRPMGEGRHVSFTLSAGGARSRAVCFGAGSRLPAEPGEPVDAAVRLEVNRYNGAVEPRLVLRRACTPLPAPIEALEETFAERIARELACDLEVWPPRPGATFARVPAAQTTTSDRELLDARGSGFAGLVADLVASGDGVIVVCANVAHRHRALRDRVGGFTLTCWDQVEHAPGLVAAHPHVVALDPPPHAHLDALLQAAPGSGYTHLAWGPQELDLTRRILRWELNLRPPLEALFRGLRAARTADAPRAEALLRGEGPQPHTPALAARLVRLLCDLGLATHSEPLTLAHAATAPSGPLEACAAFRCYARRLDDGLRWLSTGETSERRAA